MQFAVLLFLCSFFWIQAAHGDVVLTQSPESLFSALGDRVTIKCQANTDIDDDINWYQQKPGQSPKLLFYEGNNRYSGVPTRFSISGYGQDFSLIIGDLEADDAAYYHCQQSDRTPYTFGAGTKLEIKQRDDAAPVAFIFPPSKEQLKTNSATVVCLISSFYPSELNVIWKVDGKAATGDIQTSAAAADTDKTYKLSSTLTLSTEEYNSHESYTCEVTHKTLSQPLVKNFKRSECPS